VPGVGGGAPPTPGTPSARSVENTPVPLLIAIPVLFVALGANPIWDANEAFYVETPRQMVLSGDYVSPTFNGDGRFNKPVLSYWVVAGLYHLFGVSVAVERVGIALGALGIVLATCLIGRALASARLGLLAALLVVTAPRFVLWSRRIFIDIHITMYMALTLACFVLAERAPAHRRRYLLLMYVAMGLGVLTKGPVALVLPAAVVVAWLAAERRLADLGRMMILPGVLVLAAIVVPWYALLYAEHGWEHIVSFFVGENIGRFTTTMVPAGRGYGFYLPVLLTDLFPWAPLLVVPLAAIGVSVWRRTTDRAGDPIRRLLWWWIVVIVAAFSLSETKQDLYIFPVVPAVAVLVADELSGGRARRATSAILMLICVAVLGVAAAAVWLIGPAAGPWALRGVAPAGAALAAAAVGALALARHRTRAVMALAGGFILFNYVLVARVLPDLARFKPVPPVAEAFRARAAPTARLAHVSQSLPSLVFYANHSVEDLASVDAAVAALSSDDEWWILTPDAEARAILARAPAACTALRHAIFDFKIRQVIAREPPPEVVLVTNKCPAASSAVRSPAALNDSVSPLQRRAP